MPINSSEWGNRNAKMPLTYKIKWKCNFGRTKCITIIQSVACLCVSFVHLTFPWIMCCSKYVCKKNFHIRILTLLTTLQPTFIILFFFFFTWHIRIRRDKRSTKYNSTFTQIHTNSADIYNPRTMKTNLNYHFTLIHMLNSKFVHSYLFI